MDIGAVMDGIGTNVAPATGLLYMPYMPDMIADVPALYPRDIEVTFDLAMKRGQDRADIVLQLLLARVDDLSRAAEMNGYIAGSGASSLKALISSDRQLGGACQDLSVTGIRGANGLYEHAGYRYLGAQIVLFVIGRGN